MGSKTEFEIKFFVDDKDALIHQLTAIQAKRIYPERLMKRVNIDPIHGYSGKKRGRVRSEGDKTTFTLKSVGDDTCVIDCVQEIEVTVSSFDDTIAILQGLGIDYKNYQETKREKRIVLLGEEEIEVCIDTRPGIPQFVEIEGPNQELVESTAKMLGFDTQDGFFGSADLIYERLGICSSHDVNHRKKLSFDEYPGR